MHQVFLTSYNNNEKTQYYYKLEPKTNKFISHKKGEWNLSNTNNVIYSDLNPGNYTFRVVARNYDRTS